MVNTQTYTVKQALEEILFNNKEPLSTQYVVYKHRYGKGKLSQKIIDNILNINGFVILQETLYVKK